MFKTLLTTSRNPSLNLKSFVKKLINIFPNAKKINRGRKFINSLISYSIENEIRNLILIYEVRGNPNCLIISHLPSGPSIYFKITNFSFVKFKNDINLFFSDIPILMITNLNTPIGLRLARIIANLYPKCSNYSKRIITYIGTCDNIICNQYLFEKDNINKTNVKFKNIGPRLTLKPFKIILGNIAENNSNIEWVFTSLIERKKKIII